MTIRKRFLALAVLLCALAQTSYSGDANETAPPASAPGLEPVTITATRVEQRNFDVPASVDTVNVDALHTGQPAVNLSEQLGRVPGVIVRNRQNYAQDLQVSSRGFGARAAFGVRGVRLLQDGIPFTTPDGQGQTGLFDLDSAARIEVLRGPFAALYGNSSGGVVSLFTEDPPLRPTLRLAGGAGSYGAWKLGGGFGTTIGDLGLLFNASRFAIDGYRDHSRTRRDLIGAKFAWNPGDGSKFTLTATTLNQPDTEDPLGLTREQLEQDRRQAGTGALAFDTRKSIDHRQVGLGWERRLGPRDTLKINGYLGDRRVTQFLAFSGAGADSSGGVVDLDRNFGGASAQWTRTIPLAWGPFSFTLGLDYDSMSERRKGFVNDFGTVGDLRRNELDSVYNLDEYAIAEWWVAERWKLSGGVRHSSVDFKLSDDFVNAVNPDDSGRLRYSATRPVLGLLYTLNDSVNLYASAGRGFETPTFTELAYRPDGRSGLNTGLDASTSTNFEVGVKAQAGNATRVTLALFRSNTRNDIVPDVNAGGRATFRNAARTTRRGLELGLESELGSGFNTYLAYTLLDARFRDYRSNSGEDLSGNALPGAPKSSLYGEIAWRHKPSGFATALEGQWNAKVYADDANSADAGSYSTINWRIGYDWRVAGWRVTPYLRIDNLFDTRYVGSVIVNASNGRYYEPAPGRNFFGGVKARYTF